MGSFNSKIQQNARRWQQERILPATKVLKTIDAIQLVSWEKSMRNGILNFVATSPGGVEIRLYHQRVSSTENEYAMYRVCLDDEVIYWVENSDVYYRWKRIYQHFQVISQQETQQELQEETERTRDISKRL